VRSMDEMASRESDEVVGRIYVLGASREPPRFYLISQRWEGEAKLFSLQESWSDQRGEMRLLVTDREGSELILRPDFSYMRRFVMGPYAVSRAGCLADIVAFPIIVALSIVITGGFVAWFVALAPLQYATFAICGTLSRRLLRYPMTYGYDAEVERVQVYPLAESDVPKQIAAVQFRLKPVTTTLAVSALVLWLLSLIQ
jgi:hypothetical protein